MPSPCRIARGPSHHRHPGREASTRPLEGRGEIAPHQLPVESQAVGLAQTTFADENDDRLPRDGMNSAGTYGNMSGTAQENPGSELIWNPPYRTANP